MPTLLVRWSLAQVSRRVALNVAAGHGARQAIPDFSWIIENIHEHWGTGF